mmetsp:Transcript_1196/g.2592  ORF Transcript_1196/g.2592 Transcript_1196/m.2592 type:complete len:207 (-) Transcript_1196:803-1423(-)
MYRSDSEVPAAFLSASVSARPTRTTMPVSPMCRLPPTTLTWSPILKYFCSNSAGKESGSVRASCCGRIVTVPPPGATHCTTPLRCFRSPSTTLTMSPTLNVATPALGMLTACSSSMSASPPSPALKRSSSASVGTTVSSHRRLRVDTSLMRQPSSNFWLSNMKNSRPPLARWGPVTSPSSRCTSSGRNKRACGRMRSDCSPSAFCR